MTAENAECEQEGLERFVEASAELWTWQKDRTHLDGLWQVENYIKTRHADVPQA